MNVTTPSEHRDGARTAGAALPPLTFDRPDAASPFLSFVRKEFLHGRGSALRQSLADKTRASDLIRAYGIKGPRKLHILSNIEDIVALDLPNTFVLKFAHGWSTRGVMLLTRLEPGLYFCRLALRTYTVAEIVSSQVRTKETFMNKKQEWIIEEIVTSAIRGKPIPFDYKFYCFRSRIGLIVQIDRNTYPPKVCLLDEDFTPLRHLRDYVLRSKNAQFGTPIIPLHAPELLWCARKLSLATDAPFVSVDLYDSPEGPSFGEFTFSPGGTYKRMWVYGSAFLDRLDALFEAGETVEETETLADLAALPRPRPEVYGLLASAVASQSSRAANRLAALYADYAKRTLKHETVLRGLSQSWIRIEGHIKKVQVSSLETRTRFLIGRLETAELGDNRAGQVAPEQERNEAR